MVLAVLAEYEKLFGKHKANRVYIIRTKIFDDGFRFIFR